MKSKTAIITAAAVVVTGALVLTSLFVETTESTVLADVLENVEQAQAFMCKMDTTLTGSMIGEISAGENRIQTTAIISNEYGMKCEMDMGMTDPISGKPMTQQAYVLPEQNVMITIMPQQKQYMRITLDDESLAETAKENNDPREMMRQILDCEYTELGRSKINGIEVEGFETTDPKFAADVVEDLRVRLWVEVGTGLPVRWEMDMTINEQIKTRVVISDFQWDIQVAASDFEPVIPDDYTSMMDGDFKMPSTTEEAALEGLKVFVDMSGRYPKKLDIMSLTQEFLDLEVEVGPTAEASELEQEVARLRVQERPDDPEAAIAAAEERIKLAEEWMEEQEARIAKSEERTELMKDQETMLSEHMERTSPVLSLGMFYMTLAGKEPAYYGETVGPDDADAVLMRWKASHGKYRVVMGDLSTADVTPEELAELEKH
ncbi:MAG: LolA family protein [Planctomycetota bacterium]